MRISMRNMIRRQEEESEMKATIWMITVQEEHGPRANPTNRRTTYAVAAMSEEEARMIVASETDRPIVGIKDAQAQIAVARR